MLRVVLKAVTGTVPSQASISQLTINIVMAILLRTPLYLIDAALLLSSHGTTNNIAIAAPITTKPPSLSGTARNLHNMVNNTKQVLYAQVCLAD